MSEEEWHSLHELFQTCPMSMVMDYKHGRITSVQLLDLIVDYCEEAHKIGLKKMMSDKPPLIRR